MKTDIWMPLYIGDYFAGTQHLSCEESGAYLHLLMFSWMNGPLPSNEESLRRIARVEPSAWGDTWRMLQAFFKQCSDGKWVQDRLERERAAWLQRRTVYSERAAEAAKKRWKNAPSNAPSIPEAMPE